jgi:hypothetical protein
LGINAIPIHANSKVAYSLESNFREIYHAVKYPSREPLALVANFSGTKIYDSRYGWGRLWRWFYHVADWITGHFLHLEKLKKAILHTHNLFQQEITEREMSLKKYLEYLEKSGKGYSVNEESYFFARSRISEWNAATKPFLKLFSNHTLEKQFSDLPLEGKIPIFYSSNTPLFHYCQKIIDLEGMTGAPLPLAILRKIIKGKPLNALDQKDLDKWIHKINKKNLKVTTVYKALAALTRLYKKDEEDLLKPKTLPRLLLFLEDKGCTIFQKPDAKHLTWRQQLEEGTTLSLNDTEVILGRELYPQAFGSDQTRAYHIHGQPDRIALIAHNKIALMMRDFKMHKQTHFGIAPALLLDISTDGKIATMEHLKALNTIKWTSTKNQITSQDEPLISVLTGLVQSLIKHDITPSKFNADHLMFNEQFQLKSLKPSAKGPFDFNALEDFMMECASKNLTVYKELMTKSGLSSHPTAKFYRDLISSNFFERKDAPDDLAAIYRISDPKVIDRGISLVEQINTIKKHIHPRLRELLPKYTPKQIEKKIKVALLKVYGQHKSAGVLWPTLLEDTLKCVVSMAVG